jgi:imidazolonepropionase-like amidohydrolase
MKMKKYILLSMIFLAYFQLSADNLEIQLEKGKTCAYIHANIYTEGAIIENASMIVENGLIVEVGNDVDIPAGTKIVDMMGKCIYPSFINAYSALGVTEVFAVWQTIDGGEKEDFNPNIKVKMAFNAESAHVPVTRANGIAYNVTVPMSGIIPGTSALMRFKGWNWQEMLAKAPVSLVMSWPTSASMTAFGAGPSLGGQSKIDQLYAFFDEAKAYLKSHQAGADLKHDLRMEAMIPVLKGEIPVWVTANKVNDIQSVLSFADQYKLKIAIVGGLESLAFADLLKEREIPVIVPNVFGMPSRTTPSFDAYYSLPSKLYEAGIAFCISVGGNMEVRNLPYHAGKASSYGLPADVALKAITQYPANIIGVGTKIGSLDKGKEGSFIVTDGNPLEITTKVLEMYIQGEQVSLENKHKSFYDKYKTRYNQK